LKTGMLSYFKR